MEKKEAPRNKLPFHVLNLLIKICPEPIHIRKWAEHIFSTRSIDTNFKDRMRCFDPIATPLMYVSLSEKEMRVYYAIRSHSVCNTADEESCKNFERRWQKLDPRYAEALIHFVDSNFF